MSLGSSLKEVVTKNSPSYLLPEMRLLKLENSPATAGSLSPAELALTG
jgi:hypothetical protein